MMHINIIQVQPNYSICDIVDLWVFMISGRFGVSKNFTDQYKDW